MRAFSRAARSPLWAQCAERRRQQLVDARLSRTVGDPVAAVVAIVVGLSMKNASVGPVDALHELVARPVHVARPKRGEGLAEKLLQRLLVASARNLLRLQNRKSTRLNSSHLV